MPLVGDRVRSASRPHRSLRRLRRRLFASAPPPMHQPSHAPGPAAAGRRYRRALQVVARRFPSLCTRPRRPPPSPPLVATLIAAAANDSHRRSQRCAERHRLRAATGQGRNGNPPKARDRDLTVKGSRHLTFHITVKLTIKEEMLNLTCRQTFSFTQARPELTLSGLWQGPRSAAAHAGGSRPRPSTQVERAALLCLRRSRYAQPSVRCVHA